MKSVIGIFDSHEKAALIITHLQRAGYPYTGLSIIEEGKNICSQNRANILTTEFSLCVVVCVILGALNGGRIIAIPGLEFTTSWGGPYLGGFLGLWASIIVWAIVAIITVVIIEMGGETKFGEYFKDREFILMVEGDRDAVSLARDMLLSKSDYKELNEH